MKIEELKSLEISERNFKICVLRIKGYTHKRIGETFNISGGRVAQIIERIERKTRGLAISPKNSKGEPILMSVQLSNIYRENKRSQGKYNKICLPPYTTFEEFIFLPPKKLLSFRNFGRKALTEKEKIKENY